ncbi:MAG: hypothetical protein HYV63_24775 [Candidatus Schekmanbacteria bacterium]|nr:hypothetical protein [Candidatus Schekmanbacteria bacterium]
MERAGRAPWVHRGLPSGFAKSISRAWRIVRPDASLRKEVQLISDLIDVLERAYNIDPRRIYADGLSGGGGMAFVLACRLSDRIAAVGMVVAARTLPWSWCQDADRFP